MRGDEGAGDRRRARAAVGLEHVAVERDRSLAEGREIEDAAQRPADEALDLLRATALLAARRLAVAARVRRPRQHAVLGRQPALAAAALVRRHLLLDRSGAQDLGVTEGDEHRAFGMARVAAREGNGPQRVVRAALRSLESHAAIVTA